MAGVFFPLRAGNAMLAVMFAALQAAIAWGLLKWRWRQSVYRRAAENSQ